MGEPDKNVRKQMERMRDRRLVEEDMRERMSARR